MAPDRESTKTAPDAPHALAACDLAYGSFLVIALESLLAAIFVLLTSLPTKSQVVHAIAGSVFCLVFLGIGAWLVALVAGIVSAVFALRHARDWRLLILTALGILLVIALVWHYALRPIYGFDLLADNLFLEIAAVFGSLGAIFGVEWFRSDRRRVRKHAEQHSNI